MNHTREPSFDVVDPPEPFSRWERAAIDRLLALDHPWTDVVREQLNEARVTARCAHCPSIDIVVEPDAPRLPRMDPPLSPPALHGRDADGMWVEIVLIPSEGVITALDVWRGDLARCVEPPLDTFGPAVYWNEEP